MKLSEVKSKQLQATSQSFVLQGNVKQATAHSPSNLRLSKLKVTLPNIWLDGGEGKEMGKAKQNSQDKIKALKLSAFLSGVSEKLHSSLTFIHERDQLERH